MAEDVRLKALETVAETKKRKTECAPDVACGSGIRNKRKAALEYFKLKHENELDFKHLEHEVRKQEIELKKKELDIEKFSNENLMKILMEFVKK